jgi:hypothetical protein
VNEILRSATQKLPLVIASEAKQSPPCQLGIASGKNRPRNDSRCFRPYAYRRAVWNFQNDNDGNYFTHWSKHPLLKKNGNTMRKRILALIAAWLFLLSLLFPYWVVAMSAPTYPEGMLAVRVYANKVEGDIDEWNRVGRLVGVKVPPPIPDQVFILIPLAVVGLAGLSVVAAFQERLLKIAAIAPWVVLAAILAWAQYSLYLFGQNLDPDRPLKYIQPFTPPVIGWVTLGKISTYHLPHLGGVLFGIAGLLLAWTTFRFSILDFRSWIWNRRAKIENPESKTLAPHASVGAQNPRSPARQA